MVAPGWHDGHVFDGLAFDLLRRRARVAAGLPCGHPCGPVLERLELAGVVGAMTAVAAGLDRHAAAFTGGRPVSWCSPLDVRGQRVQRTGPGRAWPSGRAAARAGSICDSAAASRSSLSTSRWRRSAVCPAAVSQIRVRGRSAGRFHARAGPDVPGGRRPRSPPTARGAAARRPRRSSAARPAPDAQGPQPKRRAAGCGARRGGGRSGIRRGTAPQLPGLSRLAAHQARLAPRPSIVKPDLLPGAAGRARK
jgi:hypothetical protein